MVNLLDAQPARTLMHSPPAVSVDGIVIPHRDIAREMQNHAAGKPAEAWTQAARALVVRELLLQEARRLGIAPQPVTDADRRRETDDEALVRALVAREVQTPEPQEHECRRYFDANRPRFRTPDLYEVSHILLAIGTAGAAGRAQALGTAAAIIAQLEASPALFPDLAALHSACPSAAAGGSLGQIGPGQTVPEFEAALGRLPVGRVAPQPVETRYGLHVVRVERRIEGNDIPFEMARDRIARWLSERVRRTAIRQYIGLLAGRSRIEGVAFASASSPLLQ